MHAQLVSLALPELSSQPTVVTQLQAHSSVKKMTKTGYYLEHQLQIISAHVHLGPCGWGIQSDTTQRCKNHEPILKDD